MAHLNSDLQLDLDLDFAFESNQPELNFDAEYLKDMEFPEVELPPPIAPNHNQQAIANQPGDAMYAENKVEGGNLNAESEDYEEDEDYEDYEEDEEGDEEGDEDMNAAHIVVAQAFVINAVAANAVVANAAPVNAAPANAAPANAAPVNVVLWKGGARVEKVNDVFLLHKIKMRDRKLYLDVSIEGSKIDPANFSATLYGKSNAEQQWEQLIEWHGNRGDNFTPYAVQNGLSLNMWRVREKVKEIRKNKVNHRFRLLLVLPGNVEVRAEMQMFNA